MTDTIDKTVTLNLQCLASGDDAQQKLDGSAFSASGVSLSVVFQAASSTRTAVGLRFPGVNIHRGATIEVATLELYVGSADDPKLTIYGDDQDDAPLFSDANKIIGRSPTSASVAWDSTGIGTGWKSPADLKTIVQEIVNRAGWNPGQALALLLFGDEGIGGPLTLTFLAQDAAAEYAAKLTVEWTHETPVGGVHKPRPAWWRRNSLQRGGRPMARR